MDRRDSPKAEPPKSQKAQVDDDLDNALEDTFPASDPPAMTHPHRKTEPKKPN